MLKITEKYYLGSNKNTMILYQKKVGETGKESYKSVGYFTTLDGLYASLLEKEIRENLELLNNIEQVKNMIDDIKEFTVKYVKENK